MKKKTLFLVIFITLLGALLTGAAPREYQVLTQMDLANARGINNQDQIACSTLDLKACLWWKDELRELGNLGGAISHATAINNKGQIVGYSWIEDQPPPFTKVWHAFLWDNGSITDLGTLGHNSFASAINDRGEIVGYSTFTPGGYPEHAFLWENGVLVDLGTLGGDYSVATGINNRGQVVGYSSVTSGSFRAFLWENGVMINLGTLGGDHSVATGINNRGQVVGYSSITPGEYDFHAFLWENGVMVDLGTNGGTKSEANGINNRGQIIGTIDDFAVLWNEGNLIYLNVPLGAAWTRPDDINDGGKIVGECQQGTAWVACIWKK